MTLKELTDRITAKGRGPLFAAAVALLAGLISVFTLPPTDRDESRFAEASAQMLETGDFTAPMFQDQPRFKKPVGIYWLQAASVKLVSGVERRDIWAYRIPSLLGAALAAAACAWGAAAFLRPWAATMAGAILGCTTALSTEATIATTDAALCGAVTLSMAALGRLYLAEHAGPAPGRWTKLLFWLGLAASILLKGPIGPMVAFLTIVALVAWARKASDGCARWAGAGDSVIPLRDGLLLGAGDHGGDRRGLLGHGRGRRSCAQAGGRTGGPWRATGLFPAAGARAVVPGRAPAPGRRSRCLAATRRTRHVQLPRSPG